MDYGEVIKQLESIKEHSRDMSKEKDADKVWKMDVDALTEAIDIISDYEKATAQTAELIQKYEQPAMAVRRAAGLYTCPLCGKRTQVGHTHCHWCGQRLGWEPKIRPKARRKR